jgi:methylase of polypeptide subunit release factors
MTTEEIYLDKIWTTINQSLEDEVLLSLDQEEAITLELKNYGNEILKASEEKAVSANERRDKVIQSFKSLDEQDQWKIWSEIALHMGQLIEKPDTE